MQGEGDLRADGTLALGQYWLICEDLSYCGL